MTFQHVARVTAVADLVADVERGPLLLAVEQLSWIPARVAGQSCKESGRGRGGGEKNVGRLMRRFVHETVTGRPVSC